jgi:hypothetical protein
MPGKIRCRLHGGASTGPRTATGRASTVAALQAGRERWLKRMRLAKQRGEIPKLPNGRRPRGAPKLSANKTVRRAQRVMESVMAKKNTLSAAAGSPPVLSAVKPFAEMSKGEKLSHNADLALDDTMRILAAPIDYARLADPDWLADPEHRAIARELQKSADRQMNTSLVTLGHQIRVDEKELERNGNRRGLDDEALERLAARLAGKGESE